SLHGFKPCSRICEQLGLQSVFQHRVSVFSRSGKRFTAHSRYHHWNIEELLVWPAHRLDRLLPGTDCEGRCGRCRNQHDFQRGDRYHNRDRLRHGLQCHLHELLPDMSTLSHMVELRDVHMHFEEKKVLEGVSLDVQPQERLVIMGQSGSGKSTILRLILGILRSDSGSIFFKQFEINRLNRRKLQQVRQHIGMVYQYSALLSSLTVRENVALPLEELTDKSRTEIDRIVDEKLELVGMEDSR